MLAKQTGIFIIQKENLLIFFKFNQNRMDEKNLFDNPEGINNEESNNEETQSSSQPEEEFSYIPTGEKNLITNSVEKEITQSYIDYAMSVIISRALPDTRDGFKPVLRRILY
ncbi:hypothetical protein IJU97_03385 [bacterium]|nr:hypothetical protein [bacterium]